MPPSLEEIQKYISEKKLSVKAEDFYNYFTEGKWIDSKGNEVKNWKQKILTWNNYKEEAKDSGTNKKNTTKTNFEQRQYGDLDKIFDNT